MTLTAPMKTRKYLRTATKATQKSVVSIYLSAHAAGFVSFEL